MKSDVRTSGIVVDCGTVTSGSTVLSGLTSRTNGTESSAFAGISASSVKYLGCGSGGRASSGMTDGS